MHAIDMHCDTLSLAFARQARTGEPVDIYTMPGSVDLDRLHRAGAMAQFFAAFLPPAGRLKSRGIAPVSDMEYVETCARILQSSVAAHSGIAAPARTAAEIRRNAAEGKVSAVFTVEDGRLVEGNPENLRHLYDLGVRALSLTWNYENCFGAPNSTDPAVMSRGLTDFGKEAVVYMQQLGMLVDVSHLSDGGFYDVAARCKKPFVATHSNARALAPHPRNLTDDMIHTLGSRGGVTGLNFYPLFLNRDPEDRRGTAARMAEHARYIADRGGVDCVAIGTDFDGMSGELEIGSPLEMERLAWALEKQHFTLDQIDKIFHGNVLRVMEDAVC